jgi:hypothetical protein
MSATRLDTPFLEGAVRSTNYFNGRILSREDMQRDRDADLAIHQRFGQALGEGIVRGFEVDMESLGGSSVQNPVVNVRPGLALNRLGQTVALDRNVQVSLLKPSTAEATTASPLSGQFNACAPPDDNIYVTGTGVYLLSVAPAQTKQGLALVSGLGNDSARCNAKEVVDGVQFRLFQVKGLSNADLADEAHLQNVAAYKFFLAAGAGGDAVRDPFSSSVSLPVATDPLLTDCDVPLAILYWTALGGLRWVDLWSVRRRLTPETRLGQLPVGPSPHLVALGEAMLFQFQDHIQSLFRSPGAPLVVVDNFTHLPPVGLLRLDGNLGVAFFSKRDATGMPVPLTVRGPMHVEGARVVPLLDRGLRYAPIDVRSSELIWLYFVRENLNVPAGFTRPPPYVIFASGHIPYQGDPHFDVSKWGFANYALT